MSQPRWWVAAAAVVTALSPSVASADRLDDQRSELVRRQLELVAEPG